MVETDSKNILDLSWKVRIDPTLNEYAALSRYCSGKSIKVHTYCSCQTINAHRDLREVLLSVTFSKFFEEGLPSNEIGPEYGREGSCL